MLGRSAAILGRYSHSVRQLKSVLLGIILAPSVHVATACCTWLEPTCVALDLFAVAVFAESILRRDQTVYLTGIWSTCTKIEVWHRKPGFVSIAITMSDSVTYYIISECAALCNRVAHKLVNLAYWHRPNVHYVAFCKGLAAAQALLLSSRLQ